VFTTLSSVAALALLASAGASPTEMPKAKPAAVKVKAPKPEIAPALAGLANVQEASLPNGLQIRLIPSDAVPMVSYYTFFRVGSRNERPGITGISHLFEHMMFNGAKKYGPGAFDKVLESSGGSSNAYTTNDLTVYHEEFVSESLEKVIDLESDRMRSLTINDKVLERERHVVMEERRLRVDNEIIGTLDEELATLVWKAHPYRWPVIGWMKDIEAISSEDCREFFRTYYAPNNATVYVVGDFDPKQALALIKKYYGTIPKGPPAPAVLDSEPDQKGERRALVEWPAQAPSVLIGYRGPKATGDDTLVLDVIQYALSVGQSSRLKKELVYGQELAVSVSADWGWRIDPGVFMFHLELKPGAKAAEVEKALYAQLEKVAREGLTDSELVKAKNNLKAHLLRELATNGGRANSFGTNEMLFGSWASGLELPIRYDAITNAQVKQVAAKIFADHNRSVTTVLPKPSQETAGK
jgi:zinc protease